MVEEGLVMLIQAGLGSPPLAPGGFFAELPKDLISATNPMAWTYRSITSTPNYNLETETGWTDWTVQLDSHGLTSANAIQLARAIAGVLRGFVKGTLPDPDNTLVFNLYRQAPLIDGFSDVNRSYVRSLEYVIQYFQT